LRRMRSQSAESNAEATASADPYVIIGQLGAEGKDKICYEGKRGLHGRPVAVAQFRTQSTKVHPELRRRGTKSSAAIRMEAAFQRRAAAAGLAPGIIEEDSARARLVMELLPGGTLKDVAERQGGRLTGPQQRRLVHLMQQLGAPTASGGAAIMHNDLGNPCNFLCDSEGTFYLIDFGMAKEIDSVTRAPLELPPALSADANLLAIQHLLWDVQQGLVTHRILTELPSVLVTSYEAVVGRLTEARAPASSSGAVPRGRLVPTASATLSAPPVTAAPGRSSRRWLRRSPRPHPQRKGAPAVIDLDSSSDEGEGAGDVAEYGGESSHRGALGASPSASASGVQQPRRAALAIVWLVSIGVSVIAFAHSPRGLHGTVPNWLNAYGVRAWAVLTWT